MNAQFSHVNSRSPDALRTWNIVLLLLTPQQIDQTNPVLIYFTWMSISYISSLQEKHRKKRSLIFRQNGTVTFGGSIPSESLYFLSGYGLLARFSVPLFNIIFSSDVRWSYFMDSSIICCVLILRWISLSATNTRLIYVIHEVFHDL